MASNWEEQFDILVDNKNKGQRKAEQKKDKPKVNDDYDNDFFDLEQTDNKKIKLPIVSNKTNAQVNQKIQKQTQILNLKDIASKKLNSLNQSETLFQENNLKKKSKELNKKKQFKNQQESQAAQNKEEQAYNEQFQAEQHYDEEFQQLQQKTPLPFKKDFQNANNLKNEKKKFDVQIPSKQKRKVESLVKKSDNSNRFPSRNSIRSTQKINKTKEEQFNSNKYTFLVQKSFPDTEQNIELYNIDKLTRENDRVRSMIKNFNQELNQLINKNIMLLKTKKQAKTISSEQILKVLQQQKNSNMIVLQNTKKQLQKLKGKQGQLKQEQFQFSLQQKIAQSKNTINQYTKLIPKLRHEVNNEGNKLYKIDKQNTFAQYLNEVSSNLIKIRKQQEKNQQNLVKLQSKAQELNKKNSEVETKYNNLAQQAKKKGISITNDQLKKKYDDIKKKIQNIRLHKAKVESLFKTKADFVIQQNELIKHQLKVNDQETKMSIINCQQCQTEIKKTIDRAKKSSKITQNMIYSLDSFLNEMQNGYSQKEESYEKQNQIVKNKKYQSQKNVEKLNFQIKQMQKSQDDNSIKKPVLFKKKDKQEEKGAQRIWKDDKNILPESKNIQKQSFKEKDGDYEKKDKMKFEEKQIPVISEQKKKPFVIKKNKQQNKIQQPVVLDQKLKQNHLNNLPQKKQNQSNKIESEVPVLAPRMMKFKKAKQNQDTQRDSQSNNQASENYKKDATQQAKAEAVEEDKAIIVPKRFNMKLRNQRKSSQNEEKIQQYLKPQNKQTKNIEDYKPKKIVVQKQFNIQQKKQLNLIQNNQPETLKKQEGKPMINLKLKDRQKETNQPIKIDIENKKQDLPEKIAINLSDQRKNKPENISKQNNNPYAIQIGSDPVKKERQGPLRKDKNTNQKIEKKAYNIYDQAEDLTANLHEQTTNKNAQLKNKKQDEASPNLNKILGIEGKAKGISQDLILEDKKISGRGNKKQTKKDTNFFADLEI